MARQTALQIPTRISPGSGTIVRQPGQTYTVLTNLHVVAIGLVTDDGLLHPLLGVLRWLANTDRAIVLFRSAIEYKIAPFSLEPGAVSEAMLVVGFPAGAEVGSFADHKFLDGTRHVIYPWSQSKIENRKSSRPRIYPWGRL
ncbi:hypothetical protein [Microcoleus sp. D2_18a_B4]|uniref:hypothetical protein n=1 Tax=Microcoleus sp. D2_18a_B4 TaxID=3055329 RepID=UPI002FD19610